MKEASTENAKGLRKNMTDWERKLWYLYLRDYPVKFQRQKILDKYIADFCCSKAMLIVELDGKWHHTGEHGDYDLQRQRYLESLGYTVLRFNNSDVTYSFDTVCKKIDWYVKEQLGLN